MSALSAPRSTHRGSAPIGNVSWPCAVLDDPDRTRVFVGRGLARGFGFSGKSGGAQLTRFLNSKTLSPYRDSGLLVVPKVVKFHHGQGGGLAHGYPAVILPRMCSAIIDAAIDGLLQERHRPMLEVARRLNRGLSEVGVVALVDEATGFERERPNDTLRRLIMELLSPEERPWQKRIPDWFYEGVFRLKDWDWPGSINDARKWRVLAGVTRELIYDRMPSGMVEALDDVNPVVGGKRSAKHHQHLKDAGLKLFDAILYDIETCMTLTKGYGRWGVFMSRYDELRSDRNGVRQARLMDTDD
ncbi:P63C domain-containing protein [Alienimonas sp. DA493]|uniref:P63C domain-containing protein n=1 Tax=Alienimonas sp. DA493 TaxID=3373605 RepID=UPI003754DDF7